MHRVKYVIMALCLISTFIIGCKKDSSIVGSYKHIHTSHGMPILGEALNVEEHVISFSPHTSIGMICIDYILFGDSIKIGSHNYGFWHNDREIELSIESRYSTYSKK